MANDLANTLMESWGFSPDDSSDLLAVAQSALLSRKDRTGEVLVSLKLATQEEVEEALRSKPQNVLTLDYLSEKLQGVRPETQRLLAILHSYPYFVEILPEWVHPLLIKEPSVQKRCDELNAVLLKTPLGKNLLVFSDYAVLTTYVQEGRLDRVSDPVRASAGELIVGLGDPGQLIRASRLSIATDPAKRVVSVSLQDNFWAGIQAKTEGERILARILDSALERRATDIEIAPKRNGTSEVRIRVYGEMRSPEWNATLGVDTTREVCRLLISKSRAGDGGRLRAPADGQITYKSPSSEVYIRCSFIPSDRSGLDHDMISVSLRLLPRQARPIYLNDLNVSHIATDEITKALYRSQGLIVVSGPTNSGKSTTIAGIVGEHIKLFGNSKKRLSLEDPVERYLDGITQITVDDNFADLMRHLLRHDPDMVWVGEIRDGYSASSCVRAATSGHVVMSTVHANDSILSFRAISNYLQKESSGLDGAGATVFDLAESTSLLLAQRLVKRLCSKCKEPTTPNPEQVSVLLEYMDREGHGKLESAVLSVLDKGTFKANPTGCPACLQSGYTGELPILEVLPVTRDVKTLLGRSDEGLAYSELAPFRKNTLFQAALERFSEGQTELASLFV